MVSPEGERSSVLVGQTSILTVPFLFLIPMPVVSVLIEPSLFSAHRVPWTNCQFFSFFSGFAVSGFFSGTFGFGSGFFFTSSFFSGFLDVFFARASADFLFSSFLSHVVFVFTDSFVSLFPGFGVTSFTGFHIKYLVTHTVYHIYMYTAIYFVQREHILYSLLIFLFSRPEQKITQNSQILIFSLRFHKSTYRFLFILRAKVHFLKKFWH